MEGYSNLSVCVCVCVCCQLISKITLFHAKLTIAIKITCDVLENVCADFYMTFLVLPS